MVPLASTQVGWYGLGSMGLAMATNLQKHLVANKALPLIFSNRTLSRGKPLATLGAIEESSFDRVVARCGIIFTMVSNDAVLKSLISSPSLRQRIEKNGDDPKIHNKVFIDCSTVHPNTVASAVKELRHQNATFLSAPVFGGNPVALAGKLVFALGGGSYATRQTVLPLIQDVMGRKVIDCGDDAMRASLLKIAGNIVTINLMEAVGEAQVFAEKTGLGREPMEELINEAFGAIAGGYSKRLTSGAYAPPLDQRPSFGVSLAIKDADHALAISKEAGVELPGLDLAKDNMLAARQYAGDRLDSSSMYGVLRQKAGLAFWTKESRQGNE